MVILPASNWTYTHVKASFLKKSLFYLQVIEHTHILKPDFSKIVILSASNRTYTHVKAWFLKKSLDLFYLQVIEHKHKLKPDFSKIFTFFFMQFNIHTCWNQISQKLLFYLQAIEHTHKLKSDFSKIIILSASNWTYTQVEARFLKNHYFICKQLNISQKSLFYLQVEAHKLISQKSLFYLQAIEHTHKLKPDFSKIVILSVSNWTYTQVEARFLKNRYFICKQLNIHTSWSQISQKSLFYLQAIEHTHRLKPDFSKNPYFICKQLNIHTSWSQISQKSLFYLHAIEHTHKLKPDFSKNGYFICK